MICDFLMTMTTKNIFLDVTQFILERTLQTLLKNSGSTVVKVLCYKSEGRWFDPSWCQWIFH